VTDALEKCGSGHLVPARTGPVASAAMALCVGLLTAATLGPLAGVVIGVSVHLSGIPDAWAIGVGTLAASAVLVPVAALARRVWRIERDGLDRQDRPHVEGSGAAASVDRPHECQSSHCAHTGRQDA